MRYLLGALLSSLLLSAANAETRPLRLDVSVFQYFGATGPGEAAFSRLHGLLQEECTHSIPAAFANDEQLYAAHHLTLDWRAPKDPPKNTQDLATWWKRNYSLLIFQGTIEVSGSDATIRNIVYMGTPKETNEKLGSLIPTLQPPSIVLRDSGNGPRPEQYPAVILFGLATEALDYPTAIAYAREAWRMAASGSGDSSDRDLSRFQEAAHT